MHDVTKLPDDTAHPLLPPALTVEMTRLFNAGYALIPVGGEDGKQPAVSFANRNRLPLSTVIDRMGGSGRRTYGVRLKGILVVDVDTDTEEARAYVEASFGTSPGRTRTSRGYHLWFRYDGKKPKKVRLPGIAIDFKSGPNEFVVGPESERPDGVIYWPESRIPSRAELPVFVDRRAEAPAANSDTGPVPVGSRNDALVQQALVSVRSAATYNELLEDLHAFRDSKMADPQSFSDDKVAGLAKWAWDLELKGEIWGGLNPVVVLKSATVKKMAASGHHRALSLLAFLKTQHGADPQAVFAIDPRALHKKGHFRGGVGQVYATIKILIELGELVLHRRAAGNRNHHEYRLGSGERAEQGERAYSYISTQNEHPKVDDVKAA